MEKETIIFLHGIVGNKNAFSREIEKLKNQYQCIAYDLYDPDDLGVEGQLTIDLLLDQLYSKYIKYKIKKAHLCGFSFGCMIATAFAKKYPDMVSSMTFVGGHCCNVFSKLYTNISTVLAEKPKFEYKKWIKYCAPLLNPNLPLIPENSERIFQRYALQVHPDVFEKALRIHIEFDSSAALEGMKTPIMWVLGEYDELTKGTLFDLQQYIPHVEYIEIANAGHAAHVHQHVEFMSLFQDFLNKHASIKRPLSLS
ncbi:alpha/beta fold hydrolase [Bacillus sp. Marseille-P3661]|uniref:alpha/beta fold hydrolase n=1 Tax=Bacillus sp. Marseille-P3661 TaxID=1936234 RepID=UPI002155344E|nr:alpha/beta hydrolase [Bacillus sp. Marseille-P3661]